MEQGKKTKLKIVIPVIVVILIILFIILILSNSNNNINTGTNIDNNKGTRSNPYKIGDTIEITDIYDLYATSSSSKKDIPFKASITFNEVYSTEQGINMRKSKGYDTFTAVPIANISFEVTGNYDDKLNYDELFKITYINEDMEEKNYPIENENQEQIGTIYTGNRYTVNLLCGHDTNTNKLESIKYFIIKYYYKNFDIHSIYIEL